MLWKHAALGDERAYGTYKAVDASSITAGYLVAVCLGNSASFDGTQVVKPASGTAANLPGFIGVAVNNIAPNAYGLVQLFGPCASVAFSNVGSSLTINVGDPLVPGASAGTAFSLAPTYAASGFTYISASAVPAAISASGWMSGFIRHGL